MIGTVALRRKRAMLKNIFQDKWVSDLATVDFSQGQGATVSRVQSLFHVALCFGLVLLVLTLGTKVSQASDAICVVCKGPDLTYRCNVLRNDGTSAGREFQYHCLKEIAREGAHQSCSVKRNNSGLCEGLEKTIVYDGVAPNKPANSGMSTSAGTGSASGAGTGTGTVIMDPSGRSAASTQVENRANDAPEDEVGGGEPKTLIELTDQTVKGSKKQLKKTGAAIGGAAKKTGAAIGNAAKKTGDTVVGAVKKTGSTVGGAVKKTGKAIGGAAKSTLNCVTSLFSKCF